MDHPLPVAVFGPIPTPRSCTPALALVAALPFFFGALAACRSVPASDLGPGARTQDSFALDCLEAYGVLELENRTDELCEWVMRVTAPRIAPEICARLRDPDLATERRARLILCLDHPRLARDEGVQAVLDELSAVAENGETGDLATQLLVRRAGAEAPAWLRSRFATLPSPDRRRVALDELEERNPEGLRHVLADLYSPSLDDDSVLALLEYLAATPESLALIEAVMQRGVEVREAAAESLLDVPGGAAEELRARWLASEPEADVLAALSPAPSRSGSWTTSQALGPPDVTDPGRDDGRAWTYRSVASGEHWLELGFPKPLRCEVLRIWEVNVAGGVTRVIGATLDGAEETLWVSAGEPREPGRLEIRPAQSSAPLAKVRLVIDSDRSSDWYEIDAVELVGPDGSAWASSARASSSYGDGE